MQRLPAEEESRADARSVRNIGATVAEDRRGAGMTGDHVVRPGDRDPVAHVPEHKELVPTSMPKSRRACAGITICPRSLTVIAP